MLIRACRACLDTKFSNHTRLTDCLLETYKNLVNTKISDSSDSPNLICEKCSNILNEFAQFKRTCEKSEIFWESLLNNDVKCHLELPNVKLEDNYDNTQLCDYGDIYNNDAELQADSVSDIILGSYIANDLPTLKIKEELTNLDVLDTKRRKAQFLGKCDKCSGRHTSKKRLIKHIKTCTGKRKYTKQVHKDKEVTKTLHCGLCLEEFKDSKDLGEHLQGHFSSNCLECKLCECTGRDFADMLSHRFKHLPQSQRSNTQCFVCHKRNVSPLTAEFHFRKFHLNKPGGWCRKCDKVLHSAKNVRKHERLHVVDGYKCDLCGRRYVYKSELAAHLIDHGDVKQFVCDTCGRSFKRHTQLRGHIRDTHTVQEPALCSHCGKTFKTKRHLKMHTKLVNREKPLYCQVCGKQYTRPGDLRVHMTWHSSVKPYACQLCDKSYKAACHLKIHMVSHTGLYTHRCDVCEKQFATRRQLVRHGSVHTGVRRYKCRDCSASFHDRVQLIAHVKMRHQEMTTSETDTEIQNQLNAKTAAKHSKTCTVSLST